MAGFNSPEIGLGTTSGSAASGDAPGQTVNALIYTLGTAANADIGELPGQVVSTDNPWFTNAAQIRQTSFSNANYTIPYWATVVTQTGVMSAARTVTLPPAAWVPAGRSITVRDTSGSLTRFNKLTFQTATNPVTATQDTLNGATTNTPILTSPYSQYTFISDGVSAWTRDFASANVSSAGDASITAQLSDRCIDFPTTLTATRTVTLPDATKYPIGVPLRIQDSGAVINGAFVITIAASGGQNINGASTINITNSRGAYDLYSNGSNWKFDASLFRGQYFDDDGTTPTNLPSATGTKSIAVGDGAVASKYGQYAEAAGKFSTAGDAQFVRYKLRNQTTNNTTTELTGDAGAATSSNTVSLSTGQSLAFTAKIHGKEAATGDAVFFERKGLIKNFSGSSTLTGSIATVGTDISAAGAAAWTVAIAADGTHGGISVKVAGENSKTINWVAVLEGALLG